MLVLSRRVNESIIIPGLNVTVRVVGVQGGKVRLGIEAPKDVALLREELAPRTPAVVPDESLKVRIM